MTLRTQLTLGFTLVTLAGVGSTGALLISTSYRDALQRVRREQLLLAENRADAISGEVTEEVERLHHLGGLLEHELENSSPEPERSVLRHARTLPRFFAQETSAVGPDGTIQWTEPPSGPSRSVANAAWFARARRTAGLFVTDDKDASARGERARLVLPIWRADGDFAGCITSVLDPSANPRWSDRLAVSLGQSGTAAIIDRSGAVVVEHGAPEIPVVPARDHAVRVALGGGTASEWGEDAQHRRWLVTAVPLGSMGWALMTRQAADELDDTLDPELRALALLLLLGIGFAVSLGVISSGAIAGPIVALARTAREVERGQFEGLKPATRGGELGDLERAFHSMTNTLESRVRERTDALEKAQAELVEQGRFAAMGKTAAAIAHELKNALNGLGTATELLLQGKVPESAQAAVREQLRAEVARLRDITDNLNLFGSAPRLSKAPQALRPLVDRAISVLADRLQDSAVQLDVEWPSGMPAVACDGLKIQGVLINLVKNAVEAVEPRVDEDVPQGQVVVRARALADAVEIEIADSGPGIAEDVARHMFEPFYTTKRTGTGLGLAISRRIAETHGGSLRYLPNLPRGTRLVLQLPLSTPDHKP